jgi:hypothetical protein
MAMKTATTKHEIAKPEKPAPGNDQETAMAMHKAVATKGRRPMANPDKMTPGNKRVAPKGRY